MDINKRAVFSILFLSFLLLLSFPYPEVEAQEDYYHLEVSMGSLYYVHGENARISVIGNASFLYTLKVLGSDGALLYQTDRTLNEQGKDELSLPIPESFPSGTYNIEANISDTLSRTWCSIVNTANYTPEVFPYRKQHKGVNYTIFAKKFTAVSKSGNITVKYPSLPISFSVNAYANNMSFVERLRNEELNIHIDLSYLFIHSGMKIMLNGSIPSPTTYSFKFMSPKQLIQKLDVLRDGFLVFDWSDMRKAAQAFSYNSENKELTVNIPETFVVDPYVFEDGFDDGTFDAWTGTTVAGGATVAVVSTDNPHHGTYHMALNHTTAGNTAYAYKDITTTYTIFCREYVKFETVPADTDDLYCQMRFRGTVGTVASSTYIKKFADGLKWVMEYRSGAAWATVVNATPAIVVDTWYCVERKTVIGTANNGSEQLWIDGVSVASASSLDNDDRGAINQIQAGGSLLWNVGDRHFIDCVVIDTSYIGPEASNNAPSIGEFAAPSTVYANTYGFVNATVDDADGVADFENCTVQLNGTIQLKWVNSTNTFSELADGSNFCTLDASNSVKTSVNSTAVKLSWKVKLYWNYTEGSIFINGTVWDDEPASGTGGPSSLFTFEDDLIVSSVSHDPPEPEHGQTFTVSGQLYYAGTSTAPEDGTGITVRLWKQGFIIASTTSVSSGVWSISHNEPEPGEYYYTVYSVTDETSTQNQTERVDVVKGGSGQSYTPPSHDEDIEAVEDQGQPDASSSPLPSPGNSGGFTLSPMIIVAVAAISIVLVTAYKKTPTLKSSSKKFNKPDKKKKPKWKRGKPWE